MEKHSIWDVNYANLCVAWRSQWARCSAVERNMVWQTHSRGRIFIKYSSSFATKARLCRDDGLQVNDLNLQSSSSCPLWNVSPFFINPLSQACSAECYNFLPQKSKKKKKKPSLIRMIHILLDNIWQYLHLITLACWFMVLMAILKFWKFKKKNKKKK